MLDRAAGALTIQTFLSFTDVACFPFDDIRVGKCEDAKHDGEACSHDKAAYVVCTAMSIIRAIVTHNFLFILFQDI